MKSRCKSRIIRLAIPAFLGLAIHSPIAAQEQATITVMHTTDLHGHILPEGDYSGEPAAHGLARLATLISEVRGRQPNSLLFDAGDCIQGSPMELVAHLNFPDQPDPMMEVMNTLGYNAMTIGNHEFDFGWPVLRNAAESADFPFLSANILKDGEPIFTPFQAYTVDGVRIGVIGLTTPAIPNWLNSDLYPGLTFEDAVTAANRWVPILKEQENPDAIILVIHQGLEKDSRTGEPIGQQLPGENAAFALASEVPGINLIIMGHTHQTVPFARINGVHLTQAGRWAENLGIVRLRFSREDADSPWQLGDIRSEILPVTLETEANSEILSIVEPIAVATRAYLDRVIADATGRFDTQGGRFSDNTVLDLIHDAQLDYTGATVSFSSLFNTRASFGPGPVRVRDISNVYYYENTLYTIEVTGQTILDALEHSAKYFAAYDFRLGEGTLTSPGVAGFNYDTAAGVTYEIDLTRPPGQRIQNLRYRKRLLEPDRKIRLALNSYRANGGGGYEMFVGAKVLDQSKESVRDILIAYLEKKRTLRPEVDNNWTLLPTYLFDPSRDAIERLTRRGVFSRDEAIHLDPGKKLDRGVYADWLGRAYGPLISESVKPGEYPYPDLPPSMADGVALAFEAGAFATYKDDFFRPFDTIDLLSAVDWTAHAAYGGKIPDKWNQGDSGGKKNRQRTPPPALLRPGVAPDGYGKEKLPKGAESYAVENAFLAEWNEDSNPLALEVGDGARLLAAARYPVITILETSDFHGALTSRSRDRTTNRPVGSSAVLASYIKRERSTNAEGTILLSGGDLMQGTLSSNLNFGRAVFAQMNRLEYDAAAIGNHEFDWTIDTLRARINEANFPLLGANCVPAGGDETVEWAEPYRVLERRGLQVGVIGLCTVTTPTVTMPKNVESLRFLDPIPITQKYIDRLRRDGVDIIVLVGHLPGQQDSFWEPVSGELADLAAGVEGEHAALGGHSHNFLLGRVGETPVLIPGANGRGIGRIDIVYDRRKKEVVESDARIITTFSDAIEPDAEMAAFVDSIEAEISELADRVLCDAPQPLTRNRPAESGIGNWVSDAIRIAAEADVALQNPGGLRDNIDAGPVTIRDVFQVMPFDNRVVVVQLTGDQLREAVEQGLNTRGCVKVSGVRFTYDRSRPSGERLITLTLADGSEIEPGKIYSVATNDFMAQGGDGFTVFAEAEDLEVTSILVRDAMIQDCVRRGENGEALVPPLDGRIEESVSGTSSSGS